MAWEWSHTAEAYHHAELQLRKLSEPELITIWAEWTARSGGIAEGQSEYSEPWSDVHYHKGLRRGARMIRHIGPDGLAEQIWEKASAQATCDNGGWSAWMCPYGCSCHTVPFSSDDAEVTQ